MHFGKPLRFCMQDLARQVTVGEYADSVSKVPHVSRANLHHAKGQDYIEGQDYVEWATILQKVQDQLKWQSAYQQPFAHFVRKACMPHDVGRHTNSLSISMGRKDEIRQQSRSKSKSKNKHKFPIPFAETVV